MEKFRTQIDTDASGNRNRTQVPYEGNRSVNTVSGGRRFVHYIIDVIAIYLFMFILGMLIAIVNPQFIDENEMILNFSGIFTFLVFYTFFEAMFAQTPGKMIMRVYVIDEYGNKPSFKACILRTLIRLIPFEGFSCLGERGWHDEWTKTYVVQKKELDELHRLMKEQSGDHTLDALVTA